MSTNPFAGYPVEGDPEGELIVINRDDELEFCDDGDFPTAPSVKMEENVHPNVNNGMVYVPPTGEGPLYSCPLVDTCGYTGEYAWSTISRHVNMHHHPLKASKRYSAIMSEDEYKV